MLTTLKRITGICIVLILSLIVAVVDLAVQKEDLEQKFYYLQKIHINYIDNTIKAGDLVMCLIKNNNNNIVCQDYLDVYSKSVKSLTK